MRIIRHFDYTGVTTDGHVSCALYSAATHALYHPTRLMILLLQPSATSGQVPVCLHIFEQSKSYRNKYGVL